MSRHSTHPGRPGRILTATAAALVTFAGLTGCSAGSEPTATEEDLQSLENRVSELEDRVGALEEPSSAASERTGTARLSEACVAALTNAQGTYAAIEELGAAARDRDAVRLDEIVRQLQPLQIQLKEHLAACKVDTDIPAESPGSTPLPSSSASPTD